MAKQHIANFDTLRGYFPKFCDTLRGYFSKLCDTLRGYFSKFRDTLRGYFSKLCDILRLLNPAGTSGNWRELAGTGGN